MRFDGLTLEMKAFVHKLIATGWDFVSDGRHRRCFARGNVVIKIPHTSCENRNGGAANKHEAELYKMHRNSADPFNGAYYAPCRLLKNGALMMRRVNDLYCKIEFDKEDPSVNWIEFLSDGPQVGFSKGKVFAYDYADDYKGSMRTHKSMNAE